MPDLVDFVKVLCIIHSLYDSLTEWFPEGNQAYEGLNSTSNSCASDHTE